MTAAELRSLADEATQRPQDDMEMIRYYDAQKALIALAPDLARLCAEMGEALAIGIEDVLLMDSPEGDSPRNIASNLRAALAKLSELEEK